MTALAGPRIGEWWRLDAITPAGGHVATLDLIPGSGSHDWDQSRTNPLGMSCEIAPSVDLAGLWLRLTHGWDGHSHTLATCVATSVTRQLSSTGETWDVQGIDPTSILSDMRMLRRPLVLPAAAPVVTTTRALLAEHAPELSVTISDSSRTLRDELSWQAGTPVLTVVNALLDAIGHTPLRPDVMGGLHSSPWVPAGERPTRLTVGTDAADDAPFRGQSTVSRSLLLPTEVVAVGQGRDGVVARYIGQATDSPVVATIRGNWTDVDAAMTAGRREHDRLHAEGTRSPVDGPWQPIEPGQVVRWVWPRHGIDQRMEVLALSTQWRTGSPTTYQLLEAR